MCGGHLDLDLSLEIAFGGSELDMRRMWVFEWAAVGLFLLLAAPAWATKPCPPPPCAPSGIWTGFDAALCFRKARWVAVGRIVDVRRDKSKRPKQIKGFDRFTFHIVRWEKGRVANVDRVRMQVGWCRNARVIPPKYGGLWRIYGANAPRSVTSGYTPEYLDLRRVGPKGH